VDNHYAVQEAINYSMRKPFRMDFYEPLEKSECKYGPYGLRYDNNVVSIGPAAEAEPRRVSGRMLHPTVEVGGEGEAVGDRGHGQNQN
jgi:hypothetical protein